MVQPKVSIIIPVYNAEAYLPIYLDTIFKQTYPRFEVLAINDGSTDYSLKRLKEYAVQDARLQVFDKPSKGQLRLGMLVWITQRGITSPLSMLMIM